MIGTIDDTNLSNYYLCVHSILWNGRILISYREIARVREKT